VWRTPVASDSYQHGMPTWGPQGPSVRGVQTAFTWQFPKESLYTCIAIPYKGGRARPPTVVGRAHASLLTNSDTWHSKLARDIGCLRIFSPTKCSNLYRTRSPGADRDEPRLDRALRLNVHCEAGARATSHFNI
jgi:hypothetical protein